MDHMSLCISENETVRTAMDRLNCASMKILFVTDAAGRLSETLTDGLRAIFRLLQNNNITGRLPPELGALPRLQTLDLSNNRFSGRVPDTLGHLSKLRYL